MFGSFLNKQAGKANEAKTEAGAAKPAAARPAVSGKPANKPTVNASGKASTMAAGRSGPEAGKAAQGSASGAVSGAPPGMSAARGDKKGEGSASATLSPVGPREIGTEAGGEIAAEVATEVATEVSGPIVFEGRLLTAIGGPLKVSPESRNLCALFEGGLWLVSASHRNSPLVTSVALQARRQGVKLNEPRYVTPDVIRQAYQHAERQVASVRLDENAIRRKIVETLQRALEMGANDVHVEASGNRTKVEFRVDGALRLHETWTQREGEQFLSAVYSHSSGQSGATANWLEPQAAMLTPGAGPDQILLPQGVISVRCQWIPIADGGRYLDMRLQYDASHIFGEKFVMSDVDILGFSPEQTALIRHMRQVPGGMRIFSGPVNQGKTTTLRVMLNRRMAETNMQLNCLMIEDPPEGGVIGARQIGVSASVKDEQREKTFVEVMRCALRLDPDIVMLGETRDLQTAKFSFRLALTGRQVYTTLHVYSAIAIPQRLRDLGVEHYLVYDPQLVRGMICQRLTRLLCRHCRIPLAEAIKMSPENEDVGRRLRAGLSLMDAERGKRPHGVSLFDRLQEPDMRNVFVANSEGCKHCYKGRQGRTVLAEVIEADSRIMELLRDNRLDEARAYWLSPQGMNGITILWHGLEKIRRGEVSPQDVEFETGPLARDRDIQEVEQRLGYLEKWKI